MEMGHDFTAHITEAPVIEITDGVVHVRYRSGQARLESTMSVRLLTTGLSRGKRALERYAAGEQNVIVDD